MMMRRHTVGWNPGDFAQATAERAGDRVKLLEQRLAILETEMIDLQRQIEALKNGGKNAKT